MAKTGERDERIQNKWDDKRLRNLRNYKRFFHFFFVFVFVFDFGQGAEKSFACFGFLSEGSLLICVLLCFFLSVSFSLPLCSILYLGVSLFMALHLLKKYLYMYFFYFSESCAEFILRNRLSASLSLCVYVSVCGRCCIWVCAVPVVMLLFNIN